MALAAFDATALEERAYKESLTTDLPTAVTFLLDSVGARVTAAALGLADARPLYRWRGGTSHPKEHVVEDRLRILFRVVLEVSEAYGSRVASAFLRSANPQLDDQAPLVVLADGDPAEAGPRVVAAARALLEG